MGAPDHARSGVVEERSDLMVADLPRDLPGVAQDEGPEAGGKAFELKCVEMLSGKAQYPVPAQICPDRGNLWFIEWPAQIDSVDSCAEVSGTGRDLHEIPRF